MSAKTVSPYKGRQKLTPVKHHSKVKKIKSKETLVLLPPLLSGVSDSTEKLSNLLIPSMFGTTPITGDRHQDVKTFMEWFRHRVDEDRDSLSLYFAEDIVLEWFGRSIRCKKKVAGFFACEIGTTRHCFTTTPDVCAPFIVRACKSSCVLPASEDVLAYPIEGSATSATILNSLTQLTMRGSACKRPASPFSSDLSPDMSHSDKKKFKLDSTDIQIHDDCDKGIGNVITRSSSRKVARKKYEADTYSCGDSDMIDTPRKTFANKHWKEGDCQPSADTKHKPKDGLRYYAETSGFIEFFRTRNRRGEVKWERKCRLRVCYSVDAEPPHEYILHAILYSDNNKCRRNLLPAFEEVALEAEEKIKRTVNVKTGV